MQKYHIAQIATLHSGVIELSDAQFARRKHTNALKPLGKGKYEILKPVQFKSGEVIGYDGDMPKAMAGVMVDEAEAKKQSAKEAKVRAKAEAEAEAKAKADAKADMEARAKELTAEIETLEAQLAKAESPEAKAAIEDQINAKIEALAALG